MAFRDFGEKPREEGVDETCEKGDCAGFFSNTHDAKPEGHASDVAKRKGGADFGHVEEGFHHGRKDGVVVPVDGFGQGD